MSLLDRTVASLLPAVPKPIVRHFSRPYIAGETVDDMVQTVKALNAEGFLATVDILGELATSLEGAQAAGQEYVHVMDAMVERGLEAKVSVKLTQMGLQLDNELCFQIMEQLVAKAKSQNSFLRIDMEDSSTTTDTLVIYERLRDRFGEHVGVVIQAYLRRSLDDVRKLAAHQANVRVCKGIYVEPRAIAYKDPEIINRNFELLVEELLEAGSYVGIATHDERLVWSAFEIIERIGLTPEQYEFQMLLGVDEQLRRIVRDAGHRVRIYVPFGVKWYAYSVRRLRENPAIVGHVLRSLL
jgi:proline dehydrogenase